MSWTNYLKLVFLSIVVNICESKRKCFFIEKPSLQLAVDHLNPIPDKVYSYENCKNLCCDTKFCLGVNYIHQKNTCDFISLWTGDSEEQKSKTDINTKENVYRSVSFNQRLTFEKARTLFGSNSVGNCNSRMKASGYYCDGHKTCLNKSNLCDGIYDCLDGTDEDNCQNLEGFCIDKSGIKVKTGDTYTPIRSKDCLFCKCGHNNSVDACYSPICGSTVDCSTDIVSRKCCCSKDYRRLDESQQMMVTGLLIFLVVAIVILFSRHLLKRHIVYSHHFRRSRVHRMSLENLRSLPPIMRLQTNRDQGNVLSYSDPPTYDDLYKCHCDENNQLNCRCFQRSFVMRDSIVSETSLVEAPPSYSNENSPIELRDIASTSSPPSNS